jgi:hypothetical protein
MKAGMSSTPTDLDDFRRIMASKRSESETGAQDKNSENNESVGNPKGRGMLYTD